MKHFLVICRNEVHRDRVMENGWRAKDYINFTAKDNGVNVYEPIAVDEDTYIVITMDHLFKKADMPKFDLILAFTPVGGDFGRRMFDALVKNELPKYLKPRGRIKLI